MSFASASRHCFCLATWGAMIGTGFSSTVVAGI